jgi:DNA-binding transcriptional regulator YbjK
MIAENPGRTLRGEGRRRALLDATLRIVVREGPAAVTHRSVAAEAGATHGSVSYYFGSRTELLREALEMVAQENVAWLVSVQEDLMKVVPDVSRMARTLARRVDQQLIADRQMGFSVLELHLAAGRDPELRAAIRGWGLAYVEASTQVLRALGSTDPLWDTRVLAQMINGMVLEQLSAPRPRARTAMLQPTLERLLAMIARGD